MDVLFLFHFRLRGFYGIVHVDKEETEIVLTEARSGEEQMRWKISSVNRVFCPKTVCKRDKNKILVIITKRSVMSIASWSLSSYCQAQCPVIVTEPSMTILMNARVSQPSYPPFPNHKHKISNVSKLKLLYLKVILSAQLRNTLFHVALLEYPLSNKTRSGGVRRQAGLLI